jgi:modulator of FtsH protease
LICWELGLDIAYRVESWQVFYTAGAAAAATLTGLLFVGLSLDVGAIVRRAAHRARAREVLGATLSLLVLSLLVLVPGQSHRTLGAELIVASLTVCAVGGTLQLQTLRRMEAGRHARWAARLVILEPAAVAVLIGGISLVVERYGGLYWLVPTVLVYLVWSINNAWRLVVQLAGEEAATSTNRVDAATQHDERKPSGELRNLRE